MILCSVILRTTDAFVETAARAVAVWQLMRNTTGPFGFGEPFDWEPDDTEHCRCSIVNGFPCWRCQPRLPDAGSQTRG